MDRTNKSPSNGDAGSNKAINLWHKEFDLTKSKSKQKSGETEIYDKDGKRVLTASEQLEVLASAKVGEELIGKNDKDLGLGFDKYLGFTTTHIEIEGIKANNLCVFTKDGKYYITTKEKEQNYTTENSFNAETITYTLVKKMKQNFDNITWDLPEIHAVRRDNWRNAKEMPAVLITDNEEKLPPMMKDASTKKSDTGETQNSKESGWKRILPDTDAGIDLNNEKQLEELKHNAREKLENYAAEKVMRPLRHWWKNLFPGKEVKDEIRKNLYFKEGKILVTNKKPDGSWKPVDMSVKQLREIRENIWDKKSKVEYDLKVYVIQPPNQTSPENGSKDKEPEVLVTDNRNLVASRIKDNGWKALPGTQIGIELSSEANKIAEQTKIYREYEKLSKMQNEVSKTLEVCDEVFGKFYWNLPEEQRQQYEVWYQNSMNSLKSDYPDNIEKYFDEFKKSLIDEIQNNNHLSNLLKQDLLGKLGALEKTGEESTSSPSHADAPQRPVEDTTATTEGEKKVNGSAANETKLASKTDRGESGEQNEKVEIFEVKSIATDDFLHLSEPLKEEIAVTSVYHDLLNKVREEKDSSFQYVCNRANEILQKCRDKNYVQDENLSSEITTVNKELKEVAEDQIKNRDFNIKKDSIRKSDLNPFQLALRDAIDKTRRYGSLVMAWYRPHKISFDKNEWLKEGMRLRGIEPDQFKNICEELLTTKNKYVLEIIDTPVESTNINKIAMDCDKDEILNKYESLIRAKSHLEGIFDKLKDGLTAPKKPDKINDRQVVDPPGRGMNCLIYSLIAVSNPGLLEYSKGNFTFGKKQPIIDTIVNTIREHLVDKKLAKQKEPLNTGVHLKEIIEVMNSLNLINPKRGVLVYEWHRQKEKLQCQPPLQRDKACQDSPYAVSFTNESDPNKNHFEAMVSPEENGRLTTGGEKYAIAAGCLIEDGTWNEEWNGLLPEKVNALANEIKADLENYKKENQDETVNGEQISRVSNASEMKQKQNVVPNGEGSTREIVKNGDGSPKEQGQHSEQFSEIGDGSVVGIDNDYIRYFARAILLEANRDLEKILYQEEPDVEEMPAGSQRRNHITRREETVNGVISMIENLRREGKMPGSIVEVQQCIVQYLRSQKAIQTNNEEIVTYDSKPSIENLPLDNGDKTRIWIVDYQKRKEIIIRAENMLTNGLFEHLPEAEAKKVLQDKINSKEITPTEGTNECLIYSFLGVAEDKKIEPEDQRAQVIVRCARDFLISEGKAEFGELLSVNNYMNPGYLHKHIAYLSAFMIVMGFLDQNRGIRVLIEHGPENKNYAYEVLPTVQGKDYYYIHADMTPPGHFSMIPSEKKGLKQE